jgi:adenosylhomocysteine nucleosidase
MMAEARTLVKDPLEPGPFIPLDGGGMLTVSGIGAKRAQIAAKALLEHGATALVSWGTAGGLIPELSPGCLVLPRTVLTVGRSVHSVDLLWHEHLWGRLKEKVNLHVGPLAESTAVLVSRKDKEALFSRTNAIAVDMESAAVAAVAKHARVPFIAIRAISDTIDASLPLTALKAFDKFGRLDRWKLLRGLMQHPLDIMPWMRLSRQLHSALSTLVAVTRIAGKSLMLPE